MTISAWLQSLSLGQYEKAFADNAVDLEILADLTDADLEKLGVLLGHRKIMLRAIAALGSRVEPPPSAEASWRFRDGAERRQLTVMFCDLVSSTELSTRLDPEDLREVLGIYHATIREGIGRFDGFVARYMGDGVLVLFGYPQAHEDDAERAVRAGLRLVGRVAQIKVGPSNLAARIGIATGLVVVGELIGSGTAQERDVVGDTPNLAARLQGLAGPNTVLIDSGTRQLLGQLFEYRDLIPVEVKGFPDPIETWQVLRPSAIDSRFEALRTTALTPLVGRDDEIELLMRRWSRAKGGEGQVILLSGEPGVGKSRIAAAISEHLGNEPHRRLRYFCSPQHRDSPFYPFIVQLERAAGFTREDTPELKFEKLEQLLSRAGKSRPETVALFADLLAVSAEELFEPPSADAQQRRELTFVAMLDELQKLSLQTPILMVLEDIHWIDSTSLDLVTMIIEEVPRLPVLFVLTFRPDFQPPWTGQPQVTTLTLGRLGQRETIVLAEQTAAGKALPPEILAQIVQRADGIPLFIEELTKTILESRLVREENGQYQLDGPLPPLAIPSSLQASLMARLDRLALVKEVAQIGSAIGREFSYQLLAAVSLRSDAELATVLAQLIDSGLVFRRGEPAHGSFVFKHALVQDAAYSTLLRAQRHELHLRIGKSLEERFPETVETQPEILAHHYTQAGLLDPAIGYWRQAGERALRRSATAEAVQHLTRAIELTRSLPSAHDRDRQELDLHLALGRMIRMVKGIAAPDTLHVFSRAHELLDEDASVDEHITVLYGLWGVHYVRAEHGAAREVSEECLVLAERHGHDEAAALGHYIMGDSLWATGAFAEARCHLECVLKLCKPIDENGATARFQHNYDVNALAFLAWCLWPLGYLEQAARAASQTIARARQIGHVPLLAFALHCGVLLDAGFAHEAEPGSALADESVAFCVQHGVAAYELWARFWQGAAIARRGDLHEGVKIMRAAMDAAAKIDAKLFRPLHLGQLASAYARLDQPETAITLLEEALVMAETTKERLFDPELHRRRGELLLTLNNAGQGETALAEALTVARAQNARLWELRAAMSLARLRRTQHRPAEARDLLKPVYSSFTEGFATLDLRQARTLLSELE
jgi:class 3 adenylate cyclase/predicted ATPase/DNA polymerase III delta prime subunit